MKNRLAGWIVLGLVAIVAAFCLATTNEVTKDAIARQTKEATEAAWRELLPGAEFPDAPQEGETPKEYVYAGVINGDVVGYVAQVAVSGYGGEIEVIVGADPEGTLTGIKVGGPNFQETAGLGAKAKEPAFTDQFAGKTAPLAVDDNIDAITAATITSSAVVRGVNTAIANVGEVAGFSIAQNVEGGALGDGRYSATVNGFAGPVYVEIALDEAGVITEIMIGDERFSETAGYGQKAKEPAFYEQFIGKSGSVALGEGIDAISGATITSRAVVDAVNLALLYASDPEAAQAAAMGEQKDEPVELPAIPDDALVAVGTAEGFGGPIEATVTLDAEGKTLLMVEFGGEKWAETQGFGSRVLEPAFWQQFIGQAMPLEDDAIDVLSGATISSKAAIKAVRGAYEQLFPPEPTATPVPTESPAGVEARGSSIGYNGPVAVRMFVDGNVITSIKFGDDEFDETKGFGSRVLEDEFAAQFIGKTLPLADGDIDVLSGATISSSAAVKAVNKAYEQIAGELDDVAIDSETPSGTAGGERFTNASKLGYVGPVYVELTVDESGAIASLTIGNERFAETPGFGEKALDDAFISQFIGKVPPLAIDDIDAITGATVTTEAVVAGINEAYAKLLAQ